MAALTPSATDLPRIAERLATWQSDPWAGHLHPGDLGWRTLVGAAGTAEGVRVWSEGSGDLPVAIGLLDEGVLRLAVDPTLSHDQQVAELIATDLAGPDIVEVRGATALRDRLLAEGWVEDEPWLPMSLDLTGELDTAREAMSRTGLQVEEAGPDDAETWTSIHWSAFKGTPFEGEARERFVGRWLTMTNGPLAGQGRNLIGRDREGVPVAVTTVWTAGEGRPGLIEPMGVHRDHHGKGYGAAITAAGAVALAEAGASSANVAAEGSNPAAVATYRSVGFVSLGSVPDLRRPG